MTRWNIAEEEGQHWVRRNRSRNSEQCGDMDEALRYIKVRFQPGDKVFRVEPDGYRTDITRQVAKRGWRK